MAKKKKKPLRDVSELQMAAGTTIGKWVEIGSIKPWKLNPRKNKPVDEVAKSIARFGFTNPLLVQASSNEIIAGHTRYDAAVSLGLKTVPVRFLDVTDEEAHAIALADNKLGEKAEWDDALLAEVLRDLHAKDVPIEDAGFSEKEIQAILDGDEGFGDPDDPSLPDQSEDNKTTELTGQFLVLIECKDEEDQLKTLEKLNQEGYACRALQS